MRHQRCKEHILHDLIQTKESHFKASGLLTILSDYLHSHKVHLSQPIGQTHTNLYGPAGLVKTNHIHIHRQGTQIVSFTMGNFISCYILFHMWCHWHLQSLLRMVKPYQKEISFQILTNFSLLRHLENLLASWTSEWTFLNLTLLPTLSLNQWYFTAINFLLGVSIGQVLTTMTSSSYINNSPQGEGQLYTIPS